MTLSRGALARPWQTDATASSGHVAAVGVVALTHRGQRLCRLALCTTARMSRTSARTKGPTDDAAQGRALDDGVGRAERGRVCRRSVAARHDLPSASDAAVLGGEGRRRSAEAEGHATP